MLHQIVPETRVAIGTRLIEQGKKWKLGNIPLSSDLTTVARWESELARALIQKSFELVYRKAKKTDAADTALALAKDEQQVRLAVEQQLEQYFGCYNSDQLLLLRNSWKSVFSEKVGILYRFHSQALFIDVVFIGN